MVAPPPGSFWQWFRHQIGHSQEILDFYLGKVAMLSLSLRIKWLPSTPCRGLSLLFHSQDLYWEKQTESGNYQTHLNVFVGDAKDGVSIYYFAHIFMSKVPVGG